MSLALVRLLQLASPALPVGAYAYSQGLEWAVEAGTVSDEGSALAWIGELLAWNLGRYDAPMLAAMVLAWNADDDAALARLEENFLASREAAELRAETLQMGYSLRRLLDELSGFPEATRARLRRFAQPSYPLAWSAAAAAWQLPPADALTAYLWGWCENQVMAAMKLVPLGQAAGQRLLAELGARIPAVAERALATAEADYANFSPGLAIASSRHETQYSRLFRS